MDDAVLYGVPVPGPQPLAPRIIAEARSWLGTPFHHQGRVKGVGCDCIGLIVGVARALGIKSRAGGLLADYDVADYSRLPDGFRLQEILERHFYPLSLRERAEVRAGNVLLFRFYKHPQHVGIISEYQESFTAASFQRKLESRLFRRVGWMPAYAGMTPENGRIPSLIHCHQTIGKVAEHGLSEAWKRRVTGAYRFVTADL